MKYFRSDIKKFYSKILNGELFTFSKYADGEWAVMKNVNLDNSEFIFDNNSDQYQAARNKLIESFKFKNDRYYVGISCPCCQGQETFQQMKDFSEQDDEHLTWANLWVNSNYKFYVQNIIPLFQKFKIILVCNKDGKIDKLPFSPKKVFTIENNAWIKNYNTVDLIKKYISDEDIRNEIFLFCCGPFGNILAYELTKHNEKNTYLDVGSTLNPWLGSAGFDRYYYLGNNIFSNMTCTWG